jgi:lysophospholipase L1-like esterase
MAIITVNDLPQQIQYPTMVATGDSLTDGLHATGGEGFAYLLHNQLVSRGYSTSMSVAAHPGAGIDAAIASIAAELAAVHPQLVTVEWGINNLDIAYLLTKAQFQAKFRILLDLILAENANMLVLCCTIPWTGQLPASASYILAEEFNEAITTEAAVDGFPVAECWDATVGHTEYLSVLDSFHPNDLGHDAIRQACWEALAPVLDNW